MLDLYEFGLSAQVAMLVDTINNTSDTSVKQEMETWLWYFQNQTGGSSQVQLSRVSEEDVTRFSRVTRFLYSALREQDRREQMDEQVWAGNVLLDLDQRRAITDSQRISRLDRGASNNRDWLSYARQLHNHASTGQMLDLDAIEQPARLSFPWIGFPLGMGGETEIWMYDPLLIWLEAQTILMNVADGPRSDNLQDRFEQAVASVLLKHYGDAKFLFQDLLKETGDKTIEIWLILSQHLLGELEQEELVRQWRTLESHRHQIQLLVLLAEHNTDPSFLSPLIDQLVKEQGETIGLVQLQAMNEFNRGQFDDSYLYYLTFIDIVEQRVYGSVRMQEWIVRYAHCSFENGLNDRGMGHEILRVLDSVVLPPVSKWLIEQIIAQYYVHHITPHSDVNVREER